MLMLELSDTPKHHPECCLSLSSKLFRTIANRVRNLAKDNPQSTVVTSVGCGTGLFEAILTAYLSEQGVTDIVVDGVEVLTATTPY